MKETATKIKYVCEDCYESWTSTKTEINCPYCGSDVITAEKNKKK